MNPPLLEKQELQLIDFYFLGVLVVGAGFLVRALIALRVGPIPARTVSAPRSSA